MSKLWGGRFEGQKMDSKVLRFTSSLDIDHILAGYDCLATKVHVEMLEECGYVTSGEKKSIVKALDGFMLSFKAGNVDLSDHEDIHSAVQLFVESKVPKAAKKMHTGRSRNEQVVNDVRLYCMDSIECIICGVLCLQHEMVDLAKKTSGVIIPGYTHLNRAQPVLFAHLLMAYVEMLERDKGRLQDAGKRCDLSVMGSGALAGSALKLKRKRVSKKLGFSALAMNSIDAVSDRDFIVEFISALSLIAVHLSRISEDFILYSLAEFGFLDIGEAFCTGSSLMPQKKNADVLELIRGRAAQMIGALNSVLVLLKGLPHSYNRDLQEDKKFLFESVELVASELAIMASLVSSVQVDGEKAKKLLEDESIYATDIAEYLVKSGVSFHDAHGMVGQLVKHCIDKGKKISDLTVSEMKKYSKFIGDDIYGYLTPEASVKGKKTLGSTNPTMVAKEIAKWEERLK